jgi:hypothetical protein
MARKKVEPTRRPRAAQDAGAAGAAAAGAAEGPAPEPRDVRSSKAEAPGELPEEEQERPRKRQRKPAQQDDGVLAQCSVALFDGSELVAYVELKRQQSGSEPAGGTAAGGNAGASNVCGGNDGGDAAILVAAFRRGAGADGPALVTLEAASWRVGSCRPRSKLTYSRGPCLALRAVVSPFCRSSRPPSPTAGINDRPIKSSSHSPHPAAPRRRVRRGARAGHARVDRFRLAAQRAGARWPAVQHRCSHILHMHAWWRGGAASGERSDSGSGTQRGSQRHVASGRVPTLGFSKRA